MKRNTLLAVLAGLLILGMWTVVQGHAAASTKAPHAMWTIFLVLLPAGLAAMALRNVHWAAMGCVIYGTVGFALDVATVVQVISKTSDLFPALLLSGISGFLNFLLLVFGGQAFLDGFQAPKPPKSRPPSPPPLA